MSQQPHGDHLTSATSQHFFFPSTEIRNVEHILLPFFVGEMFGKGEYE